ncbi:hypothetical protein ACXHQ0_23965 [Vibrio antiquarius]
MIKNIINYSKWKGTLDAPLTYCLLLWCFSLGFASLFTLEKISDYFAAVYMLSAMLLSVVCTARVLLLVTKKIAKNQWYLLKVVEFYFIIALFFANIYFVLIVFNYPNIPFSGLYVFWEHQNNYSGPRITLVQIGKTMIDCIYFSISLVTASALGDIKPVV